MRSGDDSHGANSTSSVPTIHRKQANSTARLPVVPDDPPDLSRQRSNSLGPADIAPAAQAAAWPGVRGADPERRVTIGDGSTPRAARHETLEWEEATAARGPERSGENECIRVAVRFRPLSENELADGGETRKCVRFGDDGKSCTITVERVFGKSDIDFYYDYVFQPDVTQADVYRAVGQPIVQGVINGFNGAIIAYGQTGSGKTHTMLGPAGAQMFVNDGDVDMEALGVIPRALQELVNYAGPTEGQVQLRASYVEIYMEHIIDLLSPCEGGASIRAGSQDQAMYLPDVTQIPIASVAEAMAVMRTGNRSRHMAETKMNRHSSRSHALFVVTVTNSLDKAKQRYAQLYLVDLAGSERVMKTGVAGRQLDEAKEINKSLLALGQVIWALAHKHKHVPYRDSKLTLMLRNCLGGNARTAIMVAASPHETNSGESLSALRFGARASLVENLARMNVAEDAKQLKRLLEQARADLNELRGHCRRLQAEVAAFQAAECVPAQPPIGRTVSTAVEGSPLQAMTSKRLLIWGLLPALVCPLNRAVMRHPVCASDGWTYERMAIEKHFARAGRAMPISPVTGQRMSSRLLVPNHVVQQLVNQHLPDLHPPEVRLPLVALVHVWHVQMILSYLDSRSLGRCEAAWSSFLAAADASQAWTKLLRLDFPDDVARLRQEAVANAMASEGEDIDLVRNPSGGGPNVTARARYAELKIGSRPTGTNPRNHAQIAGKGLRLFAAPKA